MSETTGRKNVSCNWEALDQFLSDRLADEERMTLENHLSDCPECRSRLEGLAAEPAVWTETHEFLSSTDDQPEPAVSHVTGDQGDAPVDPSVIESPHLFPPLAEQILGFLSPTDDPRMLGRFGGYEIAGIIGCGGMAVVVKGLDLALNRYVAIKILAPHLANSAAARQRFAREARAAAAVVHENVTAIHAVSEANGLPYLVMPYIRGSSLQKRLDAQGPFRTAEILRIGLQAASALAAAHAQGLVHRDIKPANILLEDGIERLTITDFGLARAADDASLTRSGVIAGTPQYMSPEQARGEPIDGRSDLFGLGSVLYTLCTGRPPFRAETTFGILRRISDDTPRPIRELNPDVPEWLASIIGKLHAKDPTERYQSAEEVSRLFAECLAHVQQPDTVLLPESVFRVAPRARKRRRSFRSSALVAACVLTAIIAYVAQNPPRDGTRSTQTDAKQGQIPFASDARTTDTSLIRWNDGTEEKLSSTEFVIDELDSQSAVTWDPIPNDDQDTSQQDTSPKE
jgi:serine/threonine-protein kinase